MYKTIEKPSCKCILEGGSLETLCRCCSEQLFFSHNSFKHWQYVRRKKFLQRAKQGLKWMENSGAYFWTSPSYSIKSSFFLFCIVLSLCHLHQIWKWHFTYSSRKAVQKNTRLHSRNKIEFCTLTFRTLV